MSLNDVVGQEHALRMLTGAMKRDRVASTYLFSGEQGIGKKFTAVNFAKAVNCLDPVESDGFTDSCDECSSCSRIDAGTHPDLLVVAPEGGIIKIEQVRGIEEALSFKAFEGRKKVVIVDDADRMNSSAANAFLKTLEEPSSDSLIMLVSSNPDRLPDTVRSRCLRIRFRALSQADCLSVIGADDENAAMLARLSMGRPGLALGDDLIAERDGFMESIRMGISGEGKHPWKDREDLERWLDSLLLAIHDMAVLNATGDRKAAVNADLSDEISRMCGKRSLEDIIDLYSRIRTIRATVGFNPNRSVTWNYITSLMSVR